ncbi:metallophosphoesterase family protein [Salinigranum halophilum]|uniref:metallophosphoesterase family protein n=1 Tax=Salinigranum halophilum TaxID=2565931 RepID=UPI00115F5BAB|nr:metallophosphoesterase family protein [Salinigranum halophilum]
MRIGLLSDIHGNLPALEAVLEDMDAVDTIICVGDIVGYNPWPAECVDRVQDVCSLVVQGNHDRTVETPERYAANEMARAGLEYARGELTAKQRQWLADLPPRTVFTNNTYQLAHSHPDPHKLDRYVRPAEFPKMRPYLDDHEGIVIGHTHIQHKAVIDDRLIVNPGSVGQPRDGNSDAAYAILDTGERNVEMRRVEYDINRVISRVEEVGLPKRTGARLLDGS